MSIAVYVFKSQGLIFVIIIIRDFRVNWYEMRLIATDGNVRKYKNVSLHTWEKQYL